MRKRNPNGYGSVTKLSGNRSRPWMIRITIYDEEGRGRQVSLDYADTLEHANVILAQYNNNPWEIDRNKVTVISLYNRWLKVKAPRLATSLQGSLRAAVKHCSKYYGMKYRKIRAYHMQECIDDCERSYATKAAIKNLWGHLDRFAFECDIIDKMYSQLIVAPPVPETKKKPFTEAEIEALWKIQGKKWVDTVLIYLYTGFRLSELLNMKSDQVDLDQNTFTGGVKTASGKNRIVPIHPRILPFVRRWKEQGNEYLLTCSGKKFSSNSYRIFWNGVMSEIGATHTPHEARHTFRSRLDSAGANKKCIDLLMGHKSKDVGERVYTHKTLKELEEIVLLLE